MYFETRKSIGEKLNIRKMKVKTINVQEVKIEIKKCPISVQQYISALENVIDIQNETRKKLTKKLYECSKK